MTKLKTDNRSRIINIYFYAIIMSRKYCLDISTNKK